MTRHACLRFAEYPTEVDSYSAEYHHSSNEVVISHYCFAPEREYPQLVSQDRYPFTGQPGDWDALEEELNAKLTEMMAREGWYEHETS